MDAPDRVERLIEEVEGMSAGEIITAINTACDDLPIAAPFQLRTSKELHMLSRKLFELSLLVEQLARLDESAVLPKFN